MIPFMKPALLMFLLVPSFLFVGCAADGSFDAAGFGKAVSSVSDAYQAIERPQVVGYDAYGQPIYR